MSLSAALLVVLPLISINCLLISSMVFAVIRILTRLSKQLIEVNRSVRLIHERIDRIDNEGRRAK